METIAIIPARGGSKGIPQKNIIPLAGKPLIAYTIEHTLQTPEITRVVVSTDDDKIAEVSKQYGAEVIRRPAEISGDTASSEAALVHVLHWLKENEDYVPDLVAFLQATSPIREADDLHNAIQTLINEGADSLLSVSPFHVFLWRNMGDSYQPLNYDYRHRPMRQQAPEDVMENGSFYLFKPWVLLQEGNRLGGKITIHRMSAKAALAIDEPEDLELISRVLG